ncbi:MAG: ral nucleoside transport system permease protein [Abditibacteriota bacterium]|nr:ral nucleoside transport system permease protein [Abditibacteriota bacterium]
MSRDIQAPNPNPNEQSKESSPRRSPFFLFLSLLFAPLLALVLCAAVVALCGQNPLEAGRALVFGAAGSPMRVAESLAKTIPLVMTGLAVAVAFRGGFWNIGAEGQFTMGAVAATAIATKVLWPLPFVLLAGTVAGAAWAWLAGWLKQKRGAPEIITTIMLNYIALQWATFGVQGPLQESARSQPQSDVFPLAAQLPALIADTTLHAGLFIALIAVCACWWLLFRTQSGFVLRATGANVPAARTAGIATDAVSLRAVTLSGALAGLGGAMEIAGATKQLGSSPFGYGYTAIAVALLANLNPVGVLPAALLFGMLSAGGGAMERTAGVPAVTVSIVIGLVIFAVAAFSKGKRVD